MSITTRIKSLIGLERREINPNDTWAAFTALRTGTLSSVDRQKAEAYLRDHRQLKSMLDAAVTAAEERLRPVIEKAGAEFSREAEKRQIDLEEAATGKRHEKARTEPRTGLRRLERIDLWEVSVVTFPMLPQARIADVKATRPSAFI